MRLHVARYGIIVALQASRTSSLQNPFEAARGKSIWHALPEHFEDGHSFFQQVAYVEESESALVPPNTERHPLWRPKWYHLGESHTYICSIVLFFSGLLCSAGGIGGGGIYVTVLMVAGNLSVQDAVPLSKAVVFFGSISSLILNMRKNFVAQDKAESLINYNLCRIVVPAALIGTYFGVFFNQVFPDWVILGLLTLILVTMTIAVSRSTVKRCFEEQADLQATSEDAEEEAPGSPGVVSTASILAPANVQAASEEALEAPRSPGVISTASTTDDSIQNVAQQQKSAPDRGLLRNNLRPVDCVLALVMLFMVVICSVFRYHAKACQQAASADVPVACNHPSLFFLGRGNMEEWMRDPKSSLPHTLEALAFLVPIILCVSVSFHYSVTLVRHEGFRAIEIATYQSMSVLTGCLAGLVGIGGGLIFSPFFLLMMVEPSVAVATSSTCVIFTASSTTFQYLLTDRIVLSLTLIYGMVNVLASYAGTSFVHFLQDKFAPKPSLISCIVALGVFISTILAILQLVRAARGETVVDF